MLIHPDFQIVRSREKRFDPLIRVPYLDRNEAEHFAAYYFLRNIDIFCYFVLGVELLPFQSLIMRTLVRKPFPMLILTRGGGKSTCLGIYAALRACITPGSKVVMVGANRRQSRFIFEETKKIYWSNKGSMFREMVPKPPNDLPEASTMLVKGTDKQSLISSIPLACITGNSLITLGDGIFYIKDLFPLKNEDKSWIKSRGNIWGKDKFHSFNKIFYNEKCQTRKFTTSRRYEIECSETHKLRVLRDKEIVWVQAQDIKIGDWIPIDRKERWFKPEFQINPDEAYVLGAIIGDGHWTNPVRIGLADTVGDVFANVKAKSGWNWHAYKGGKYYLLSVEKRKQWLDFWGMGTCYGNEKYLPSKLLRANKDAIVSCLQGLFDTDGGVQVSTRKSGYAITITFTSDSFRLVKEIQYLLTHFGIISTIRRKTTNKAYDVIISGSNSRLFYEKIGFGISRKQDRLTEGLGLQTMPHPMRDGVPFAREIILNLLEGHRFKKGEYPSKDSFFCVSKVRDSKIISHCKCQSFVKDFASAFKENREFQRLRDIANPDFFYDKIETISTSESITYDLFVPDGHLYTANGFLSHNSGDRIRGTRASHLLVDEFAIIPEDIFNTVLKPTAAVSLSPVEKVKRIRREKELLEAGVIKPEDAMEFEENQVVVSSSASYQFTFFYKLYQQYRQYIIDGIHNPEKRTIAKKYAIIQLGYEAVLQLSPGYLDESNIRDAKASLPSDKFQTEYGAQFVSDSGGHFPRSLLESRQIKLGEFPCVEMRAGPDDIYILAIDPSSGENEANDWFAIVAIRLNPVSRTAYLVNASASTGKGWPHYVKLVRQYIANFKPKYIIVDAYGGGTQMGSLLCSDEYVDKENGESPLKRMEKDDLSTYSFTDNRILRMNTPTPQFNEASNTNLKSMLEHSQFWFASPIGESVYEKFKGNTGEIDGLESSFDLIEEAKTQISLIVGFQGSNGIVSFQMPESLGKSRKRERVRKDLYSSTLLGAWAVKEYLSILDEAKSKVQNYAPTVTLA